MLDKRALELEQVAETWEYAAFQNLVWVSEPMRQIRNTLARVVDTDVTRA